MKARSIPAGPVTTSSSACGFQPAEAYGGERSHHGEFVGATVGAVHRVAWKSGLEVIVESEIELVAVGRPPFVWRIPVSQAHDIQTVVDGKRTPSRSSREARSARSRFQKRAHTCSAFDGRQRRQTKMGSIISVFP